MIIISRLLKSIGIILIYCFIVFSHAGIVKADWSVWETPIVYYDFEGADGSANIKDRVGSNNLTLTATSGSPTGIKSVGKYGRRAVFLSLIHISEPTRPY